MEEENLGNKSHCTKQMETTALHISRNFPWQKHFTSFTQNDE